ncbi:ABC transporter permease [Danxiaibacter flavus]|uniref:ABC transporter permease n=1 Tax=Danxiaibacter flavus TaxID=3049108 RepID=A0ABV3Z977_9BACT|nr:ABC transporter permease [Chitinophagaceae bacterium DXS]
MTGTVLEAKSPSYFDRSKPSAMFKNYLKTAFRNLLRNKVHAIVNITGLIVGFSAFLLIFLVISYESSFDDFHSNKKNIYRVVRAGKTGDDRDYRTGVPFPVTNGLRLDYPQLKNAAAIMSDNNVQVTIPGNNGETVKKFKEASGIFIAEQRFFNMFDFKIVEGNANNAITEPNTILLSKKFATKYFGDWHTALGKVVKAYGLNLKVTGILENPPVNTDFPLGMVISYPTMDANMNDWVSIEDNNYCFIQLPPNYSAAQMSALLPAFITRHIPPEHAGYKLQLQPLKEMHFDERLGNFNGRTFSKQMVTALTLIGMFLLIIACVNFINLSTANAVIRSKEVGVRKVLGGTRKQLVVQFFSETGAACIIAMIGAIIVSVIFLPFLNRLLEINLTAGSLFTPSTILFILLSLVIVTILSGFYPALILAGFNPINVLKGKLTSEAGKGITLRRGLVVFQFVIAQTLIIGTLVVVAQMNYFSNADMGFSKEAIVNASLPRDSASRTKYVRLRDELSSIPGVAELSFSTFTPAANGGWATDLRLASNNTKKADLIVNMKPADTGYFSLYNFKMAAGRVYYPSDTAGEFVVNETLVKALGFGTPQDAIGKQINVAGKLSPIVGVVKDFHMHSLKDPIDPVVMMSAKGSFGVANVRIKPGKTKQVLAGMEATWNKVFPDYVFEYDFIDQSIADYYKQEKQLSQLYKIFSGIAIFISCLGLYGLVSFMAQRKRKEIGIRKVLGASLGNILLLLSREFTLLIAVAFLIAAPVAWYFMHHWLEQYSFRIDIGLGFFIITLICSIMIAWLTVGYSAIKAAIANPVNSLRTE